jgi:hypothetical protein
MARVVEISDGRVHKKCTTSGVGSTLFFALIGRASTQWSSNLLARSDAFTLRNRRSQEPSGEAPSHAMCPVFSRPLHRELHEKRI